MYKLNWLKATDDEQHSFHMYFTVIHSGSAKTVCTVYEIIGAIGLNNKRLYSSNTPCLNRRPGLRGFEKIVDWSFICGNKVYWVEENYSLFRSIVLTIIHLCQLTLTRL